MGVTETPVGEVTAVGVCIPWGGAHVTNGRRDRVQWQDHLDWLSGFERLSYARSRRRTIVLGDFNQRSPKRGKLHGALQKAFARLRIFDVRVHGRGVDSAWRERRQTAGDRADGHQIGERHGAVDRSHRPL